MSVMPRRWFAAALFALVSLPAFAGAEPQEAIAREAAESTAAIAADATRYLALGDSIASGYKALPATNGYPYLLYEHGVFDKVRHTLFTNAAVPGASSRDFVLHQVPQALIPAAAGGFIPDDVTVTIGGNDLLSILRYMETHPDPAEVIQFANGVLAAYGQNLFVGLAQIRAGLPAAKIYVGNQYGIPEIEALVPLAAPLIAAFNQTVATVVAQFPTNVHLVNVHEAFAGHRHLLLGERPGESPFETHMTNAGHRAMARAFAEVIARTDSWRWSRRPAGSAAIRMIPGCRVFRCSRLAPRSISSRRRLIGDPRL